MRKADEIVHQLEVLRIKAKKDVREAPPAKVEKLKGFVGGLNISIIAARQIANRKR